MTKTISKTGSTKLWQASGKAQLDPLVEAYTVGDDYLSDQQLLGYDITASKAHVEMLESVGILTADELGQLIAALDELYRKWEAGQFVIEQHQEDGHTAIEQQMVEQLGDIGKKMHTGRSRNDQSLVMTRLYMKDKLAEALTRTEVLAAAFQAAANRAGPTVMPGYTHLQKAMPTTVATWLGSFGDGFADLQGILATTRQVIDQNPLGSAAGFGVSVGIDREHTTKTLGFARTQANNMYCGLSRGLFDLLAVQALSPLMVLSGKFAQDMLIFTTEEFGFFSLPDSFTTGSSIMPHKHNYDIFEVMRGNAHAFGAYVPQLQSISGSIGSGYQRDLQLTKAITLHAFTIALTTLEVLAAAVAALQINAAALEAAITPEMHSVTAIDKLVGQGVPFRDAYNRVKLELHKLD